MTTILKRVLQTVLAALYVISCFEISGETRIRLNNERAQGRGPTLHRADSAAGIREGDLCLQGQYIIASYDEDTKVHDLRIFFR